MRTPVSYRTAAYCGVAAAAGVSAVWWFARSRARSGKTPSYPVMGRAKSAVTGGPPEEMNGMPPESIALEM